MKSLEIRQKFFDFFVKNGHEKVASSSLIPADDPTILFANAGMNQFKDLFLGKETRSYKRAVTIQKCIRAGGKHNDLENVGFTKRHLTFFEMMGNFSFGDYFKKDAIRFAWNFITQELQLPVDKLHVTVYKKDDEAYDIWHKEIGVAAAHITRLGEADNFWQMGDIGPCGPCTEIYIDRGLSYGCDKADCAPGCSCDRFLEFWNLVFMQFERQPDGTDVPLKQTGVDTGMGLERLCAILQNKDSVFETDVFAGIFKDIEALTGKKYATSDVQTQGAFKVLADHIRSSTFAIADGCSPSNEGRGYVLRKIIRRAALFAQKLKAEHNIFPDLVDAVVRDMGTLYPELVRNQERIKLLLRSEVDKFSANLISGQAILEKYFAESAQTLRQAQGERPGITGEQAFKLYDTYGFPLELTSVIAYERGYTVDAVGFEAEMEKQRLQSGKKVINKQEVVLDESITTEFTGYETLESKGVIKALIVNNTLVEEVPAQTKCWVIPDITPFFVEKGGQVNDAGLVEANGSLSTLLHLKRINSAIALEIETSSKLSVGDILTMRVDKEHRINTMKNHTATHLLHAALMKLLGDQARQSGSLVHPDYLRFDFVHHENLTAEQVKHVEDLVNDKIRENIPVHTFCTTYQDALSRGVIAIFGEKYNPDNVRVVDIPGFSAELCGGTHCHATGEIGVFKITENSALSAGNRRIVALTGPAAVNCFQEAFGTIKTLAQEFKVKPEAVADSIKKLQEQLKNAQLEVKNTKAQLLQYRLPEIVKQAQKINTAKFLFYVIEGTQEDAQNLASVLARKEPGIYAIVAKTPERHYMYVAVSDVLTKTVDLKKIALWLKEQGFKGGGSATMWQGSIATMPANFTEKFKNTLA